ncbi:MAG: ABC transporter substrate-binding protein [Woeseiaceae bacterium]
MLKQFAAVLVVLLLTIGTATAEDSPNTVIESAVNELAEKMDGRKEELADDRQALYEIIDGILLPRFDSRFAAQLVLARHWREASKEQQDRFIDAFYHALLRKYADGILEFDPDMITVEPFRGDESGKRATVRSSVDMDDGSKVSVDYELVRRKAGWLVFNVVIEGVSYVRNFRAELDSEIKGSSLDAVIERLESEAGATADE